MQESWMIYGAAGYTGSLIAARAVECGHRPVLAGRSAPPVTALAERLGLPHRVLDLRDPVAMEAALDDVDLVLNAAGPFLHTAAPLARACLSAGVALPRHQQRVAGVPCPLRPRRGGQASWRQHHSRCRVRRRRHQLPGALRERDGRRRRSVSRWPPGSHRPSRAPVRRRPCKRISPTEAGSVEGGQLVPKEFFTGVTTIGFPDGPCEAMPVPTGDLEAAFHATGAPDVVAYAVSPPARDVTGSDNEDVPPSTYRSFGWARATGSDGATAEAWLQTGDSYAFTPAASIRAVEETLVGSRPRSAQSRRRIRCRLRLHDPRHQANRRP